MSVHPVTPMGEADLVRHLNAQAPLSISKFELPSFTAGRDAIDHELNRLLAEQPRASLFDGAEPAHLTETGRMLHQWAARPHPSRARQAALRGRLIGAGICSDTVVARS
jgi:3-oxoisoapionate kinase